MEAYNKFQLLHINVWQKHSGRIKESKGSHPITSLWLSQSAKTALAIINKIMAINLSNATYVITY